MAHSSVARMCRVQNNCNRPRGLNNEPQLRSCNQSASTFATWSSGVRFCARSPPAAAAAAVLQSGRAGGSGGCSIVLYAPDFYARSQRPPTRGGVFLWAHASTCVSVVHYYHTLMCIARRAIEFLSTHQPLKKANRKKILYIYFWRRCVGPWVLLYFSFQTLLCIFLTCSRGKHLIVQLTTHIIWWSWATSHSVYWSHVGRPRLQRKLRFGGNSHVQKYEQLSFPLYEILTRNGRVVILQSVWK